MNSAVQSGNAETCIVGIDPGTHKCGIAVVGASGQVYFQKSVSISNTATTLEYVICTYSIAAIALGDGTGSAGLSESLQLVASRFGVNLTIISEANTTQEGNRLAFNSMSFLSRIAFLFKMLTGIESADKWAAVVIAKRAFDISPNML